MRQIRGMFELYYMSKKSQNEAQKWENETMFKKYFYFNADILKTSLFSL